MSTKIGKPFSEILQPLQQGEVLKETHYEGRAFADKEVYKDVDVDGDGKTDATIHTMERDGVERHEVTLYDEQGRRTEVFTSGTQRDNFFGLVETGKVWSHTQFSRDDNNQTVTETYERANNSNGELKERTQSVWDLQKRTHVSKHVEADRDENGSLETSYDMKIVDGNWKKVE